MNTALFADPITNTIAAFLNEIGLPVRSAEIHEETFLPGILLDHGVIVLDEAQLKYPGDVLHEAEHLAVMGPSRRQRVYMNAGRVAAEEMMAIAWSYAASLYLRLDPAVVFHPAGYRGGAQAIIDNFSEGRYIGVPMLQWLGLTADAKRAAELGIDPYPAMIKWLRETT